MLEDGNVGVGIFPECEEIFVGRESPDAGSISICAMRKPGRQSIAPGNSKVREGSGQQFQTMPPWSRIF